MVSSEEVRSLPVVIVKFLHFSHDFLYSFIYDTYVFKVLPRKNREIRNYILSYLRYSISQFNFKGGGQLFTLSSVRKSIILTGSMVGEHVH